MMILVMTMLIAGCKKNETTDEEVLDTTQHDNNFQILPDQFNPSMSYTFNGNYSITSGQPWSGVSSEGCQGGIQVVAKAGRKGSESPANWFKSNVSCATCQNAGTNSFPGELNFAFTGTITINGDTYPITLGQGHAGANNNWWIGGPGWVFPDGSSRGEICTPDKKYLFACDENLVYSFWIREN